MLSFSHHGDDVVCSALQHHVKASRIMSKPQVSKYVNESDSEGVLHDAVSGGEGNYQNSVSCAQNLIGTGEDFNFVTLNLTNVSLECRYGMSKAPLKGGMVDLS